LGQGEGIKLGNGQKGTDHIQQKQLVGKGPQKRPIVTEGQLRSHKKDEGMKNAEEIAGGWGSKNRPGGVQMDKGIKGKYLCLAKGPGALLQKQLEKRV